MFGFVGGPHDGLQMDDAALNRVVVITLHPEVTGRSHTILMVPCPAACDLILSGSYAGKLPGELSGDYLIRLRARGFEAHPYRVEGDGPDRVLRHNLTRWELAGRSAA